MALDPVARNHWVSVDNRIEATSGAKRLTVRDNLGLGGLAGRKDGDALAPANRRNPAAGRDLRFDRSVPLQMVPDANRTMILSWYQSATGSVGDVNLFDSSTSRLRRPRSR